MKGFLVFLVIICMALLYVGAQDKLPENMRDYNYTDEINSDPNEEVETYIPEPVMAQPVEMPVTRLKVTLIDELSDQFIKLENGVIQILGELHIAEDSFNYSNTFVEGDRYEITVHIKLKK